MFGSIGGRKLCVAEAGHGRRLIEFDKDDDLLMDCVSYLANLRMYCFHIAPQSRFHVKGIAGRSLLIPNSGLNRVRPSPRQHRPRHRHDQRHRRWTHGHRSDQGRLISGCHGDRRFPEQVLTGNVAQCRTTWIKRYGPRVLQPQQLDRPNPSCYVCNRSQAVLVINTAAMTLRRFFKVAFFGSFFCHFSNVSFVIFQMFLLVCVFLALFKSCHGIRFFFKCFFSCVFFSLFKSCHEIRRLCNGCRSSGHLPLGAGPE